VEIGAALAANVLAGRGDLGRMRGDVEALEPNLAGRSSPPADASP
jgi:hypothetical protein